MFLIRVFFVIYIVAVIFCGNAVGQKIFDKKNEADGFLASGNTTPDVIIPAPWKEEKINLLIVPWWFGRENQKKGYLVVKKNYLDAIDVPLLEKEIEGPLEVFLAQGEYEPVVFCIKALEDLGEFKVIVSDLVSRDGKSVISKENIDIRHVKYFPQSIGKQKYKMAPLILEKKDVFNIERGAYKQFWITVFVPEGTVSGDYFGEIVLQVAGKSDEKIALAVKVLPFVLKEIDRAYGIYYHIDTRWKGFYPFNAEKHFVDMKAHGLNCAALYVVPEISKKEKGIEVNFENADKFCPWPMDELIKAYMDAGLNKPIIYMGLDFIIRHRIKSELGYKIYSQDYDEAFAFVVKTVEQKRIDASWPKFLYAISDEPALHEEKMKICEYYLKKFKNIEPRQKIYLTLIGDKKGIKDDEIFDPWVDIRCYSFINEKKIADAEKAGDELWVYNGGSFGDNPAKDRLFYGFYAEKISADGVMQWAYQWPRTLEYSPYEEIKTGEQGWYYAYPSANGPVPTIGWEGIREGIDDAKYVYTLECLIEEAKKRNEDIYSQKIKEAESLLENIFSQINIDFHQKNKFGSSMYNKWRWQIACKILELQDLIKNTRSKVD